jgi:hypothetical protein
MRLILEQGQEWWSSQRDPVCRDRVEFMEGNVLTGPLPSAVRTQWIIALGS